MHQRAGITSTFTAPLVVTPMLATMASAADGADAAERFSQGTLQEIRAPSEGNLAYVVEQNWELAVAFAISFTVVILVAALWVMAKAGSDEDKSEIAQRHELMSGVPRDSM